MTLQEILRRNRDRQQELLAPYQPSPTPRLRAAAGPPAVLAVPPGQVAPLAASRPMGQRFVAPDDWQGQVVRQQIPEELLGPLGTVLDLLSRPLYASANVAKALLDGDGNLAVAAWKGLSGEEKTTFSNLLEAHDVRWAPLLGFVLDWGLDPLTYVPVANVLGKTMQGVRRVPMVQRMTGVIRELDVVSIMGRAFGERGAALAESAAGKAKGVIDWFGRSFSTSYKLPEDYVMARRLERAWFTDGQRQVLEETRKFVREIPEDQRKLMTWARENPELFHQLSPKAQEKLLQVSDEFAMYLDRAVDEGLLTREGAQDAAELYVPHRFNARLRSVGNIPGQRALRPTFARERSFKSLQELKDYRSDVMQIAEATNSSEAAEIAKLLDQKWETNSFSRNVAARASDLQAIQGWAKEVARYHTPIEDMAQLLALYKNEWLQYESRRRFLSFVEQKFARKVPANSIPGPGEGIYLPTGNLRFFRQELAKAGLKPDEVLDVVREMELAVERGDAVVKVPENLRRKVLGVTKQVEAWLLPEEIARDLNRASALIMGQSDEGQQLLQFFDKTTGWWKQMATVWRIPFHLRNFYSNYFQMWLGDVRVQDFPSLTRDAARILRGSDHTIAGTGKTAAALREEFRRAGILPRGLVEAGFADEVLNVEKLVNGTLLKGMNRSEALDRVLNNLNPRQWGMAVEGSARVAMTLDGLRKGMSLEEAARRTFKYLFDYDEITPFERQVMARIVPFYRWMRFNMPLQVQTMLTNPQKYVKTARAFEALNEWGELSREDYETLPEWMREFGWIKLPWQKDGRDTYAFIDLPMNDLATLMRLTGAAGADERGQGWREIASGLNPLIDLFLTFANVRTFPLGEAGRTELERIPGELTKAPFWLALMPAAFLEWVGAGPMRDRQTGKMVMGWPKKMEQYVYSLVPPLREWSNLIPGGGADIEPEDAPWRWASFVTGVRFKPVDAFEEKRWRAIERQNKLRQASLKILQMGRPLTTEELEAILRS